MNGFSRAAAAAATFALVATASDEAFAFRMIQNTATGRVTFGTRVSCSDPGGFAHWAVAAIPWSHNLSSQGGEAGVGTALGNAMSSWTGVSSANHTLNLAGTTGAGFVTDGINSIQWGTGQGCSGGCLALTALVLQAGQVIVESDITFNNAFNWNTNGGDYDVEAIAAHEFGHALGIHHTEKTFGAHKRPTMYASYFGVQGRSLESDDRSALQCSQSRYPVAGSRVTDPVASEIAFGAAHKEVLVPPRLTSSTAPGKALIRFGLDADSDVELKLFDVAGRAIHTLYQGPRGAGDHAFAWDGRTRSGRAPTGVYFARLVSGSGTAQATVILIE